MTVCFSNADGLLTFDGSSKGDDKWAFLSSVGGQQHD